MIASSSVTKPASARLSMAFFEYALTYMFHHAEMVVR